MGVKLDIQMPFSGMGLTVTDLWSVSLPMACMETKFATAMLWSMVCTAPLLTCSSCSTELHTQHQLSRVVLSGMHATRAAVTVQTRATT